MIKLDDHGYACLGAVTIEGTFHLVYSEDKIVTQLMDDGMSFDGALDFFCYNIERTVEFLKATDPEYPLLLKNRPTSASLDEFVNEFSEN